MNKTLITLAFTASVFGACAVQAVEQNGTYTGANGNTVDVHRTATYEDGKVTHTATYTGENGKTVNVQGSAGGGENEGSATGPRGKTTRWNGTTTRDGEGGYDHTGTVTGPNGKTRTHHSTGKITRGEHAAARGGRHRR